EVLPPGGRCSVYHAHAFVPASCGLIADSSPRTTRRWNASFTKRLRFGVPNRSEALVSLSVKSIRGGVGPTGSYASVKAPRVGCLMFSVAPAPRAICPFGGYSGPD